MIPKDCGAAEKSFEWRVNRFGFGFRRCGRNPADGSGADNGSSTDSEQQGVRLDNVLRMAANSGAAEGKASSAEDPLRVTLSPSRVDSSTSRMASSIRVGCGAQNGALGGSRTVNKFVLAGIILEAVLEDVDDRFVAEERAALGVGDVASVEKEQSVGIAGIDVQRASLVSVAKHLHDAGKIVMGEAAAEAGVGLRQHLGGLKAFGFADDDVFDVRWR